MRFTIEYLEESTDERSVCHTLVSEIGALDQAGLLAFSRAPSIPTANGFQIRDAAGVIVALETFGAEGPVSH